MKLTICFCFMLVASVFSQENFQVLHIDGEIKMDSSRVSLKIGDEISGNPYFYFSSETAKALLLSDTRGRIVLFKNKTDVETTGELNYYFANNILPQKEYTGSRGEDENISYLFLDRNELIIPKKIKISKIPSSKNSFYELRFKIDDREITKILDVSPGGFLKLQKSTFKELPNNQDISTDFEMYYYQSKKKSYVHLTNFKYKGIQIAGIKEEIDIYKKWLIKNNENDLGQKMQGFLKSTYGSDLELTHLEH